MTETISYIDKDINIWFLETYTSQSEISAEVNHWRKYKIDVETGKIPDDDVVDLIVNIINKDTNSKEARQKNYKKNKSYVFSR